MGRVTVAPEDGPSVFDFVFELQLEFWDKNIGDPGLARILGPEEVAFDTFSSSSESLPLSGLMRAGDLDKTACRPRVGKLDGVVTKFAA